MKIKCSKQNIKLMDYKRVRCDICKSDIHRARHLKSKKHVDIISQIKMNVPTKNPIKRVVKDENKVSDTYTKFGNQ